MLFSSVDEIEDVVFMFGGVVPEFNHVGFGEPAEDEVSVVEISFFEVDVHEIKNDWRILIRGFGRRS